MYIVTKDAELNGYDFFNKTKILQNGKLMYRIYIKR